MKNLRGEYWLTDSGSLLTAASEGDYNHEGHVMEHIIDAYCDVLGIENTYETDATWFRTDMYDDESADHMEIAKERLKAIHGEEATEEMAELIGGSQKDARKFAIRYWGWVRVSQFHVEVSALTRELRERAYQALEMAYEEEYDADLPPDHPVHISNAKQELMITTAQGLVDFSRLQPATEVIEESMGRFSRALLKKEEEALIPSFYKLRSKPGTPADTD